MPEIASSWVSILPSAKGFGPKLDKQVGGEVKRSGKTLGSSFGKAFAVAGAAAVAAGGLFLKSAVSEAADLEQSVGAINTVFKGSSKQMLGWSRQAATAVGLTQNEFNELGTLIGAQLKNGGTAMDELAPKTNNLIKLGADLSSMFGGTTKDAVGALSSALKGERDPIERYGVTLNQAKIDAEAAALGFEKVGGSLSSQAQQSATLSLITKQTADATGNFAKESDTLAHKQQVLAAKFGNLKATVGTALLPVIVSFLNLMEKRVGPMFEDIVKSVRPVVESLGEKLAPAFKAVMNFAKANPAVVKGFAIALGILAAAIGVVTLATAAFSLALQTTGIPLIIIGIAALVAGLVYAYQHSERFRDIVSQVGAAFTAFAGFVKAKVLPVVVDLAKKVADNLQPVWVALAEYFTGTVLPLAQKMIAKFQEMQPTLQRVALFVFKVWAEFVKFYAAVAGKVIPIVIKVVGWLQRTLVPALLKVVGVAVKVAGAVTSMGTAIGRAGQSVITGAQNIYNGIKRWLGKALTYVQGIPGKISSAFSTIWNGLANGLKDAINAVLHLPIKLPKVNTHIPGVGTVGGQTLIPALAKGTSFHQGGVALVGEEGPELVNLPRGSQVLTASKTRALASGIEPLALGGQGIDYDRLGAAVAGALHEMGLALQIGREAAGTVYLVGQNVRTERA